jgi:hypothetical protein
MIFPLPDLPHVRPALRVSAHGRRVSARIGGRRKRSFCLADMPCHNEPVVVASSSVATVTCHFRYPSPTSRPDPIRVRPFDISHFAPSHGQARNHAGNRPNCPLGLHHLRPVKTLTCAKVREMALVCASGAKKTGELFWQTPSNWWPCWPQSQPFPLAAKHRSSVPQRALSAARPLLRFWAKTLVPALYWADLPVVLALVPSIPARVAVSERTRRTDRSIRAAGGHTFGGFFMSDRT